MQGTSLYSRTQIPLSLAHVVTIHKSQGWTRERVKVDLGKREFQGLSFVALSRVKSMKGLMIEPLELGTFNHQRLQKVNEENIQRKRAYIDNYMQQLSRRT